MRNAGYGFNIFIILLSIASLAVCGSYPMQSDFGPGPGVFPVCISVLLLLAGAGDLVVELRKKAPPDMPFFAQPEFRRNILVFGGFFLCYVFLIWIAGIVAFSWLFLVVVYRFFEKFTWPVSLAVSTGTMMFMYGVFGIWLDLNLPVGLLGLGG